jgi:hypothetical protein
VGLCGLRVRHSLATHTVLASDCAARVAVGGGFDWVALCGTAARGMSGRAPPTWTSSTWLCLQACQQATSPRVRARCKVGTTRCNVGITRCKAAQRTTLQHAPQVANHDLPGRTLARTGTCVRVACTLTQSRSGVTALARANA